MELFIAIVLGFFCLIVGIMRSDAKVKDAAHKGKLEEEYQRGKVHGINGAREILEHYPDFISSKNVTVPVEYKEFTDLLIEKLKYFHEQGWQSAVKIEIQKKSDCIYFYEKEMKILQKKAEVLEAEKSELLTAISNKNERINIQKQNATDEQGNSIVLTAEFKEILEQLENTNSNMFITGKAGTGK